jgi:hypothetical protein
MIRLASLLAFLCFVSGAMTDAWAQDLDGSVAASATTAPIAITPAAPAVASPSVAPAAAVLSPAPAAQVTGISVTASDASAPKQTVQDVPAGIDAQTYSDAMALVKSFDMKSLLQGVTGAMVKTMVPLIDQENPGQGDKIEKIAIDATQRTMASHMAELEKNKAIIYTQLFSDAEIVQLKKFYASPVGRKLLQTTPEMMRRSALLDRDIMSAAVQEARSQILQDLKKNGIKIPKEMGA